MHVILFTSTQEIECHLNHSNNHATQSHQFQIIFNEDCRFQQSKSSLFVRCVTRQRLVNGPTFSSNINLKPCNLNHHPTADATHLPSRRYLIFSGLAHPRFIIKCPILSIIQGPKTEAASETSPPQEVGYREERWYTSHISRIFNFQLKEDGVKDFPCLPGSIRVL